MPTQLSSEIFLSYRARSATTATFLMPLDDSIGNWKPTNRLGALKPLQTERNSKIPRHRKKYSFFFHSHHLARPNLRSRLKCVRANWLADGNAFVKSDSGHRPWQKKTLGHRPRCRKHRSGDCFCTGVSRESASQRYREKQPAAAYWK